MKEENKKILILGNSHLTVFGFRGELIEQLVKEGYNVTVAFPNGPFGNGENTAKKYKCNFVEIEINRRGTNPFQDFNLIRKYIKLIKNIKPAVVLAYTVKCDIYGGIACRLLKIPFIPNITGLGKGLVEGNLTKKITIKLYKSAIKKSACVFFQNEQDKQFFIDNKIKFSKGIILPGSGVNLEKFKPLKYPEGDKKIRFTYIARVMKVKGIEEFLAAARIIKEKNNNVEFHVCGYCEEDYENIIKQAEKDNIIVYNGLVENIIEQEEKSHCIVLPTFHPEGISNVLLEAAASARPIITTNRPGCRETVCDGVTGFLIKERDYKDLVEKMLVFINMNNQEREKMGLAGRKKIEKEFDRNIVVEAYMKEIHEIEKEKE